MPRKQPKEAVKSRARSPGSTDDIIQNIIREGVQKRFKMKPPMGPAAADEMWLLGGPETTAQGGFALARANQKRKKGGKDALA